MQYSIYDLRRFDIKAPSPLVDEHRYFGNPPTPLSIYVVYGRHLINVLVYFDVGDIH